MDVSRLPGLDWNVPIPVHAVMSNTVITSEVRPRGDWRGASSQ